MSIGAIAAMSIFKSNFIKMTSSQRKADHMPTPTPRTATLVRNLPKPPDADVFAADQRLYFLSVPVSYGRIAKTTNYVVVSAVNHKYAHETLIFPADENGGILDFLELHGSYRGGTQHDKALRNAGFEVVS